MKETDATARVPVLALQPVACMLRIRAARSVQLSSVCDFGDAQQTTKALESLEPTNESSIASEEFSLKSEWGTLPEYLERPMESCFYFEDRTCLHTSITFCTRATDDLEDAVVAQQARELVLALVGMFPYSDTPALLHAAVILRENKAGRAEEVPITFKWLL